MMNTLANHGFLPHDGRNITRETLVKGLHDALNFNPSLSSLMFDMGVVANPEANATYFTFRADDYLGSNRIFNETVFNESRAYWTAEILTPDMLANSKIARQINSKAFNPQYKFTSKTEQFSLGEIAAPIIAFGNSTSGEVNRTLVEYLFLNERLPIELGWKKSEEEISLDDIMRVTRMISKAASLITPSTVSKSHIRMEL
ncbi:uncharacterized protein N7469_003028 [Penicillium citrinum]|uniref:Heme haloperoxidase family profile domain-containing protein n=2 Tax=Penicillium TaxID=5073 RepID=A0A9W9PEK3_PENCI|nr:uncharacterized protein N7469_003028 [Penicillium citrinum]KAJ5241437.1 hypothetical protein N7469_003028 [Penicillium citrinum]KAJ5586442.1 hypothetical protein N7450_006229 [Penicillium hetheringtonii]